jgi:phage baseplate assembly protein W
MVNFIGFSTVDNYAPYTLTGSELVKRDLMNELYTRRGERVMNPKFGSIIWDLLMEPSTPKLQKEVEEDIEKIFKRDPRAEMKSLNVVVLDHVIRAEVEFKFVPLNTTDTLYVEYIRNISEGL